MIVVESEFNLNRFVKKKKFLIKNYLQINRIASLEKLQESTVENLLSDVVSEKAEKRPISKSQSAFSFKELEKQARN